MATILIFRSKGEVLIFNITIHKNYPYSAEEVHQSIMDERELPGTVSSVWRDGWVILDPEEMDGKERKRNKDEYSIEHLYFDPEGNVIGAE